METTKKNKIIHICSQSYCGSAYPIKQTSPSKEIICKGERMRKIKKTTLFPSAESKT